MPPIRYGDGVRPEEFLVLGQEVWPGDYGLAEVAAALARTTNIGAWDGERLVGSVRLLTDGTVWRRYPRSSSVRRTAAVGLAVN